MEHIDACDRAIIELLLEDSRVSLRTIAAKVGLTAPSVRDRIIRMQDTGLIESFTVRLNLAAMGYTLEADLRVEPLPGRLKETEAILKSMENIVECLVVTGQDCFVARLVMNDVRELDALLEPLHRIARTQTSIVHRRPVPLRYPPLTPNRLRRSITKATPRGL